MSQLRHNLDLLATLFYEAGVTHWAISPGSRNAPIVASFLRHGNFTLHSFPDERAAAFAALGMSLSNGYPAGVICTSGTAAINLYPAVCESFYQRTPLVVVTADRPAHLIDQWDGQTIHQDHLFEPHCLKYSGIEGHSIDSISLEKTIYDAVKTSLFPVNGPVHINISLEDPIYKGIDAPFYQTQPSKPFIFHHSTSAPVDQALVNQMIPQDENKALKVLCLVGQHHPSESLEQALQLLQHKIPVLTDICSNQLNIGLKQWDLALFSQEIDAQLLPDVLITVGMGTLSKPLKQWLRKHKPKHIHVAEHGQVGDPFDTKPEVARYHDADFLTALYLILNPNETYLENWTSFCDGSNVNKLKGNYLAEYEFIKQIMEEVSSDTVLHFGNSMSIRFASWAGQTNAKVYCNRGTSGIDGSLSTAVGFALADPTKKHICILGDISFIYDAHGMWTNDYPKNLVVVVMNNGGGQIFNWIDGPSKEPKLKTYIETPQQYNMQLLCGFYGLTYERISSHNKFDCSRLLNGDIQCFEFNSTQ